MIDWPAEQPPLLVVVIDTEAEFDWAARPQRQARGVTSIKRLVQTQRIFERYAQGRARSALICSPGIIRPLSSG